VPGVYDRPTGCLFAPRCAYATAHSVQVRPALHDWQGGKVRCHYPLGDPQRAAAIERDLPLKLEPQA
jgi:dipeptide transport system ATP-binding protein